MIETPPVETGLREDNEAWRGGQGDWWRFYIQDL